MYKSADKCLQMQGSSQAKKDRRGSLQWQPFWANTHVQRVDLRRRTAKDCNVLSTHAVLYFEVRASTRKIPCTVKKKDRSVALSVLKGGTQTPKGGTAPRYVALARTLLTHKSPTRCKAIKNYDLAIITSQSPTSCKATKDYGLATITSQSPTCCKVSMDVGRTPWLASPRHTLFCVEYNAHTKTMSFISAGDLLQHEYPMAQELAGAMPVVETCVVFSMQGLKWFGKHRAPRNRLGKNTFDNNAN